jgi:hypothetical protein
MAIKLNTPDWQTAKAATTRAATRSRAAVIPGLPAEFLTTQSSVTDEFVAGWLKVDKATLSAGRLEVRRGEHRATPPTRV